MQSVLTEKTKGTMKTKESEERENVKKLQVGPT